MLESPDPCRKTTIELFLYVFFIRSVFPTVFVFRLLILKLYTKSILCKMAGIITFAKQTMWGKHWPSYWWLCHPWRESIRSGWSRGHPRCPVHPGQPSLWAAESPHPVQRHCGEAHPPLQNQSENHANVQHVYYMPTSFQLILMLFHCRLRNTICFYCSKMI